MQTTLLGLAIAFIVALIAALVGPYFVDWNRFRPQFEAEASRVIGAPVRVSVARARAKWAQMRVCMLGRARPSRFG